MFKFILGLVVGAVVSTIDEEDVKAIKDEVTKFETRVKRAVNAFNAE